ncbi:hypothetical protein [Ruminococcus albus]|uniref:hypothetical protein n=1 Tax=Ruminococcus albus TaxID=1264 RepID=UPI000467113F|nr:hypothetical protein [Ruminococcus albus]
MAGMVITLKKSKFDSFGDMLDGLLSKLGSYDATVKDLKNTVASVGCENDNQVSSDLGNAIDDIVNSEESKEEKKEKINALKQKIETFVNNAVQHEKAAADKIKEKKEDFYKKYSYLKPECEKSFFEKVGEFISENVIAFVVAAAIVLAAIVIVIVCPAAVIAIIGIIVGALSAAMGIVDMAFMALTGQDLAGWLDEQGFSTLSQIVKGVSWGLDIASIILPVGAGIKSAMTVGKKTFAQATKSMIRESGRGLINSIKGIPNAAKEGFAAFKTACKSDGFMKTFGKTAWGGIKSLTGIDDIAELKNLTKIEDGNLLLGKGIVTNSNKKHWDMDTVNMRMTPKTDEARKALNEANDILGTNHTYIPLTNENGYIDAKWDEVSIITLGKDEKFNMKDLGFSGTDDDFKNKLDRFISNGDEKKFKKGLMDEIFNNNNSKGRVALNNYLQKSGTTINLDGITFHENFDLIHENLVPTKLHNMLKHTGGREHITNEIKMVKYFDKAIGRGSLFGGFNLAADAARDD